MKQISYERISQYILCTLKSRIGQRFNYIQYRKVHMHIIGRLLILIFIGCAPGLKINQTAGERQFDQFFKDLDSLNTMQQELLRYTAPVVKRFGYLRINAPLKDFYKFVGASNIVQFSTGHGKVKKIYWADSLAVVVVNDTVKTIVTTSRNLAAEDGYIRVGDTIERIKAVFREEALVELWPANSKRIRLRHCGAWFLLSPAREILQIGIFEYGSKK